MDQYNEEVMNKEFKNFIIKRIFLTLNEDERVIEYCESMRTKQFSEKLRKIYAENKHIWEEEWNNFRDSLVFTNLENITVMISNSLGHEYDHIKSLLIQATKDKKGIK